MKLTEQQWEDYRTASLVMMERECSLRIHLWREMEMHYLSLLMDNNYSQIVRH
jgi:hypothetical protein